MVAAVCNVCAVTLATLVLLAVLCPPVQSAYFYNRDASMNYHHHPRTAGYHSPGMPSQHRTVHHKHNQSNGSNSGRLQQAAVGIVGKGRLVPNTASTVSTTPSSKLSPLDRLMNRLDLEERKLTQTSHKSYVTRFDLGNARGTSSPPMLRSSDRKSTHAGSHPEDSYEDDEGEGEDDEDEGEDDGNVRDEDEDEDEGNEDEEEDRLSQGRHQYENHSNGHSVSRWVSDDAFVVFTVVDVGC
jgi:Cobalamin biosynthesis protein CobT (nicotinate-mononucleotide:5, 6-dimethylbenzimidazole phosphoribosyltransferase)